MMLHLFFIFVLFTVAMGMETKDGPLTKPKGRELMMSENCSMLSMLPTENIEEDDEESEEDDDEGEEQDEKKKR